MEKWTIQDMMDGLCDITQVGQEKEDERVVGGSLGTIEDYLAIHEELGGREFLLAWAKANPAKFYDQLLKILEKTDAIKRAGDEGRRLEQLSMAEINGMSSAEIKKMLLER
jgi:hypothetical protein